MGRVTFPENLNEYNLLYSVENDRLIVFRYNIIM